MKPNTRVKLTKIAALPDAIVPSTTKDNYMYGEENLLSVPVDYTLTGILTNRIHVDGTVWIERDSRNGVISSGTFRSSTVTEVITNDEGVVTAFKTLNSHYLIEAI